MGFKLSIAGINKLIETGYVDEAFSELFKRIKWNQWSDGFISWYLVEQVGKENICKFYDFYGSTAPFFDNRYCSERRFKALRSAYETYCK